MMNIVSYIHVHNSHARTISTYYFSNHVVDMVSISIAVQKQYIYVYTYKFTGEHVTRYRNMYN